MDRRDMPLSVLCVWREGGFGAGMVPTKTESNLKPLSDSPNLVDWTCGVRQSCIPAGGILRFLLIKAQEKSCGQHFFYFANA